MSHTIRVNRAAGYRFAVVDMDGNVVQQAKSATSTPAPGRRWRSRGGWRSGTAETARRFKPEIFPA